MEWLIIAGIVYFWNYIISYLTESFLPFCRRIHPAVGNLMTSVVQILNKTITYARSTIKKAYLWIKTCLLRDEKKYTRMKGDVFTAHHLQDHLDEKGRVMRMEATEEVRFLDLDHEVQGLVIKHGIDKVAGMTFDGKKSLIEALDDTCLKNEGMKLEQAMAAA